MSSNESEENYEDSSSKEELDDGERVCYHLINIIKDIYNKRFTTRVPKSDQDPQAFILGADKLSNQKLHGFETKKLTYTTDRVLMIYQSIQFQLRRLN